MFVAYYDYDRFRYIQDYLDKEAMFDCNNSTVIPKTACFFSDNLDVYIDTSDGVNDDLKMQEYCGRILSCIRMSRGKKFIFFKSAYSHLWTKNISKLAEANNGKVIPFFKWSFNSSFYRYTQPNLKDLRSKSVEKKYDIGLFADFNKQYLYPKPSSVDPSVSWSDHGKFGVYGNSVDTGRFVINSRPIMLSKLQGSSFSVFADSKSYEQYLKTSFECASIINPPGIGEYTSRMMDQTALGNLIILRKNSYDNAKSWKEYIPEVDFESQDWENEYRAILEDAKSWKDKGMYYYENMWSPKSVYDYFIENIKENI